VTGAWLSRSTNYESAFRRTDEESQMTRLKGAVRSRLQLRQGTVATLPFVMSRCHQQCGNYGNSGRVV